MCEELALNGSKGQRKIAPAGVRRVLKIRKVTRR